ncbi:MAG: stage II sporulation protein R [Candidatus Fimenecus sp.]
MQYLRKKETRRKLELSLLCGLIIAVVLSVTSFGASCGNIRNEVLRMHVIANSDSDEDQAVKLKVRDAVLAAGEELFDGSLTADEAETVLDSEKQVLQQAAETVLRENGFSYGVRVEIGKDFFSTRTYDGKVTLPAGEYEAVRVILGEGKGQNWWCVMFPPLCLPAAEAQAEMDDVLSEKEADITGRNPRYEARFKIIELFEKLSEKTKAE